jgi:hypothetical protein
MYWVLYRMAKGYLEHLRKYQHLFSDSSALSNLQTTHTIQVKKTMNGDDDDDA